MNPARPFYSSGPPGRTSEFAEILAELGLGGCAILGFPLAPEQTLCWPRTGGYVERDGGFRWLFVDPNGFNAPLQGAGDLDAVLAAARAVSRWVPGRRRDVSWEIADALRERTDCRIELAAGQIFAMGGASLEHVEVARALFLAIERGIARSGRPCRAYGADLIIRSGADEWQPDLTVLCGPRERSADNRNAVTNPTLLGEVLSPSTRTRDLTDKVEAYQAIPSLQHYVILDTAVQRAWVYTRDGTAWSRVELGPDGTLVLSHLGFELTVGELYVDSGIPISPPPRRRRRE